MGLIKAAAAAVSGTMDDVWKEMFVCDAMPMEVLMVRGRKHVSNRSANTGADPDVITHGSIILVADGQCAVVVSGGRVIDSCSEPGEYTFRDPAHTPGLGGLLQEAGQRFAFGGDAPPKMQRVYYINVKESMNNPFRTDAPVSLRAAGGAEVYGNVVCSGVYSYRIQDPARFYRLVAGNVAGSYTRRELTRQITSELLTALGPAMAKLCAGGVRPSEIPAHADELSQALREIANQGWLAEKGIAIVSVGIASFTPAGADMGETQRLSRAGALFGMAPERWFCPDCGAESTGNFCPRCGRKKP